MLYNDIKAEIIVSSDETQMYDFLNTPRSANSQMKVQNFDVANLYTSKIKKKKRHRTAFTTGQLLILENTFSTNKYIDRQKRKKLAEKLVISEKSVKVWFQNRRMKNKRLSDSSDTSSDINDFTCHVENNQNNENNYQQPVSYFTPTLDTDNVNFYPEYQRQSFDPGYMPALTDFTFENYHYPTNHYQYSYQYNGSHNHMEYNQWPQPHANLCHL